MLNSNACVSRYPGSMQTVIKLNQNSRYLIIFSRILDTLRPLTSAKVGQVLPAGKEVENTNL